MSITIISGTPGAGKTSLARALAAGDPKGVHIETDEFFRFLSHHEYRAGQAAGAYSCSRRERSERRRHFNCRRISLT
jgi:adenylate kinase family enzyme